MTGYGWVGVLFTKSNFLIPLFHTYVIVFILLQKGEGNSDDYWRLEIENGKEGEILETVRHNFRLVSLNNKCVLTTTDKLYPEWGFGQSEVACNPKLHDDRAVWHIDDNRYPRRKRCFVISK